MPWPSPADYQEAIQNLYRCFKDPELKSGKLEMTKQDLPRPWAGNFAVVYKVDCGSRDFAARCFLKDQPNREQRYRVIDRFLSTEQLPCFVNFNYLNNEMLVRGSWYPILKMAWANGYPLDRFIKTNLQNKHALQALPLQVIQLADVLFENRIAHGDLQHGNIIVNNGQLTLVDYDGLFVPGLENSPPGEIGHANYQHPRRGIGEYGLHMDRFSLWLIYASLIALDHDTESCLRLGGLSDENLIFRSVDLKNPYASEVFATLETSTSPEVHRLIQYLMELLELNLSEVPALNQSNIEAVRVKSFIASDGTDWISTALRTMDVATATTTVWDHVKTDASWIFSHFPVPLKSFSTHLKHERLSMAVYAGFVVLVIALSIFAGLLFNQFRPDVAINDASSYHLAIASIMVAGILSESLVVALSLYRKFVHLDIVYEKNRFRGRRKDLEREFRNLYLQLERMVERTIHHLSMRDEELTSVDEKIGSARSHLNQQLVDIEHSAEEEKSNVSDNLRDIDAREAIEINRKLDRIRQQAILNYLQKSFIRNAKIQGIGEVFTQQLEMKGFRSASDIQEIRIERESWGYHVNEVARIVDNRGIPLHIKGIGPARARAIQAWLNRVRTAANLQAPSSLTRSQITSIKATYELQRNDLSQRLRQIVPQANKSKKDAEAKYLRSIRALKKKKKSLETGERRIIKTLTENLEPIKNDVMEKNSDLARVNSELAAYRKITFINFLLRIMRLRTDKPIQT